MIRGVFAIVVFLGLTLVLATLAIPLALLFPRADVVMRLGRVWSLGLLKATGIRPRYEGLDRMPRGRPCIFLSNHASIVDIWALAPVLPSATRFVAKHSLFRIPFFGWALAAGGFIPIDRSNRTRALRSLRVAADRIRRGRSVLLFPEGTRSRDGRLAPFKRGAFHLALDAGVPVVPLAVSGSGKALPARSVLVRRVPVRVTVAEPIDPLPFRPDDVQGLIDAVRAAIAEHLDPDERGDPVVPATAEAR